MPNTCAYTSTYSHKKVLEMILLLWLCGPAKSHLPRFMRAPHVCVCMYVFSYPHREISRVSDYAIEKSDYVINYAFWLITRVEVRILRNRVFADYIIQGRNQASNCVIRASCPSPSGPWLGYGLCNSCPDYLL